MDRYGYAAHLRLSTKAIKDASGRQTCPNRFAKVEGFALLEQRSMLTSTRLRVRKGDSRQARTDVVRPYYHSARDIPESVAAALDATAASID